MIEIGTVKAQMYDKGRVVVEFKCLDTEVECEVLQSTTGANTTYILPSENTQVVCWLENGKNLVLGSLFSSAEPVPKKEPVPDMYVKCGELECEIRGNKIGFKNNSKSFKAILNDILNTIKNITVSTSTGPSGTPLPPTITAIESLNTDINNLFNE